MENEAHNVIAREEQEKKKKEQEEKQRNREDEIAEFALSILSGNLDREQAIDALEQVVIKLEDYNKSFGLSSDPNKGMIVESIVTIDCVVDGQKYEILLDRLTPGKSLTYRTIPLDLLWDTEKHIKKQSVS